MNKYARNGTHYANTRPSNVDSVMPDSLRLMYEQQDAQRAAVLEALGQVDGIPWLTLEQLAALVDMEPQYVWRLLRPPVKRGEVVQYQVEGVLLYAPATRLPPVPFPDLSRNVPTVLGAIR